MGRRGLYTIKCAKYFYRDRSLIVSVVSMFLRKLFFFLSVSVLCNRQNNHYCVRIFTRKKCQGRSTLQKNKN